MRGQQNLVTYIELLSPVMGIKVALLLLLGPRHLLLGVNSQVTDLLR